MGSLVELLGIERATKTQGDTLTEEDVVGKSGNTTVVDLDLLLRKELVSNKELIGMTFSGKTNLGKGDGVNAVLAGNLKANGVAGLGVPGGLGTSLDLAVDLVVVRSGKGAQVVSGGDGGAVLRGDVADSGAVAGQGSLVDIIASAGTGKETLVADDGIDVGGGALEEVEEGTAVEAGLLEEQVELGTLGGGGGEEVEETLKLEALGEGVVDLNLGVEGVGGVPGLGQSQAYKREALATSSKQFSYGEALNCSRRGRKRAR